MLAEAHLDKRKAAASAVQSKRGKSRAFNEKEQHQRLKTLGSYPTDKPAVWNLTDASASVMFYRHTCCCLIHISHVPADSWHISQDKTLLV